MDTIYERLTQGGQFEKDGVFVIEKQKDGNYIGQTYKNGQYYLVRDIGPETCLQKLLTHV